MPASAFCTSAKAPLHETKTSQKSEVKSYPFIFSPSLNNNFIASKRQSVTESIRIFPTAEEADNAFIRFQFFAIILTILLVCCSCGSTKMVTKTVRDVSKDTIYLSNVQYDSIYIYQDHVSEHHIGTLPPTTSDEKYLNTPMRTDTLYIKDKSIEYRYKLLRDTIKVVQRDSIPYVVTIVQTKEITRPLTWYDHLTHSVFWAVIVIVAKPIIRLIRKIRVR